MMISFIHSILDRSPLLIGNSYWAFSVWRYRHVPQHSTVVEQQNLFDRMGKPTLVLSGPFAGTHCVVVPRSPPTPKILGTYEIEIAQAIVELATKAKRFIDIGAAEGYYAVGLAKRSPHLETICFEADAMARHYLRRSAVMNGVRSRLNIQGFCTVETLAEAIGSASDTLILCDCEGFEDELLDPQRVPGLASASIVVELHDFLRPGVSERIFERFAKSHSIVTVATKVRVQSDAPSLPLTAQQTLMAMDECREMPQAWLIMTPLQGRKIQEPS